MLPVIPTGTLVALFVAAFVTASIWIVVRTMRDSRQQQAAREAAHAEIMRRALARGCSVAHLDSGREWHHNGRSAPDDTIWRMSGSAPAADRAGAARDGVQWTLSWRIAFRDTAATWDNAPGVWERDTIQGQLLSWRCAEIRAEQQAFLFTHRSNRYDTKPDDVFSESDGPLWRRWRLQAKDKALARRVFNVELCELLGKLPLPRASNTRIDDRTVISLGPEGLQADLGVEELTPELVQIWVGVGERLISGGMLYSEQSAVHVYFGS